MTCSHFGQQTFKHAGSLRDRLSFSWRDSLPLVAKKRRIQYDAPLHGPTRRTRCIHRIRACRTATQPVAAERPKGRYPHGATDLADTVDTSGIDAYWG